MVYTLHSGLNVAYLLWILLIRFNSSLSECCLYDLNVDCLVCRWLDDRNVAFLVWSCLSGLWFLLLSFKCSRCNIAITCVVWMLLTWPDNGLYDLTVSHTNYCFHMIWLFLMWLLLVWLERLWCDLTVASMTLVFLMWPNCFFYGLIVSHAAWLLLIQPKWLCNVSVLLLNSLNS
jgi:hypothetical protein